MRQLHAQNLRVATRGTTREINRRIALNLVRTHQPISRADLARLMGTRRGAVSLLVNELIRDGAVFEGATGEAKRGRKPTFLYIDSRKRCVVAVDIRPTRTFIMVTDLVGRQLASVTSFPTERDPKRFVAGLVKRVKGLLAEHKDLGSCQGVGVVVPGVVESETGLVLLAPISRLAQSSSARSDRRRPRRAGPDRELRQGVRPGAALGRRRRQGAEQFRLHHRVGWPRRRHRAGRRSRARQHNIAGEFGHVPLNIDGPRCGCGATGCWEAYVSNLATLSRYFGRDLRDRPARPEVASLTVDDLIARARGGDGKALAALLSTARYLGLGLGSVVNAIDPSHVYIGGEITAAWDLIEATVRAGLAERALTPSAAARRSSSCRRNSIRGCAAPPRSSPPRPSPRGWWHDGDSRCGAGHRRRRGAWPRVRADAGSARGTCRRALLEESQRRRGGRCRARGRRHRGAGISRRPDEARGGRVAGRRRDRSLRRIDILVNNAGDLVERKPLLEMSEALFQTVMDVNVTSAFLMCRAVGAGMVARKHGVIVNMSSLAAWNGGGPGAGAYGRGQGRGPLVDEGAGRRNWRRTASASTASRPA